jgi:hypothetical protein
MPAKADVLVICGGAIGASVAHFVKRLDPRAEVTVVERDPAYTLASTPRVRRRPAAVLPAGEHRAVQVQHRVLRGLPRDDGRRRRAGGYRPAPERLPIHRPPGRRAAARLILLGC